MNSSKKTLIFCFDGTRLTLKCESTTEITVAKEVISKLLDQKAKEVMSNGSRKEF